MELDARVQTALDILQQQGYEALAVGGCVRDSLMGRTPKDWDVCTAARPEEVARCFSGHAVFETGLKHGTITVVIEKLAIEVTTYRADGIYTDNRRPDEVTFVHSLREDLARRDFTMNALAYNPATGLVDPFGGAEDIQDKIVRCVGNPETRFKEDGLRILRALRFASRFGFELARETDESVHACKDLLLNIAAERLASELIGILLGEQVREVLLGYVDVLAVFLPELKALEGLAQNTPYHRYDAWRHTVESVTAIRADKVLRLTMLLHDTGKPFTRTTDGNGQDHFYGHENKSVEIAQVVLRRLRLDNGTIAAVLELIKWHDKPIEVDSVVKWLNRLGEERFEQLLEVKIADATAQAEEFGQDKIVEINTLKQKLAAVLEEQQCFKMKDLAVNGKDLIALGIEPGPLLGRILNELLDSVLSERLANKKEPLLAKAKELMDALQ